MNLKTQKEIDETIESHKVSLKTFEKTFGFKKKTITLPAFMWDRILSELSTSSVFCGRLWAQENGNGYPLDKELVEWDTELMMGIEQLKKKLNK